MNENILGFDGVDDEIVLNHQIPIAHFHQAVVTWQASKMRIDVLRFALRTKDEVPAI